MRGASSLDIDADELTPGQFPGGAAGRVGRRAVVLLGDDPARSVGRALAWAGVDATDAVHVIAEHDVGVVARRAGLFTQPVHVWRVEADRLTPAAPAPFTPTAQPPAEALDLVGMLVDAGVDIVIEHGAVTGEVLGLEVARIVVDHDGARVEVGVGRHDREAFAMVHGDVPAPAALRTVVDSVRRHRRVDGPAHPLGRLGAERWLRHAVVADPARVGARRLEPLEPVLPRTSVKDVAPALAVGEDLDGRPLVVACSVGIDLDLVPAAADARERTAPDARLLVVVPTRDAHPVTRRLAAGLRVPAEVVEQTGDWRT